MATSGPEQQRGAGWLERRQVLGEALRLGACGCAACFAVSSPRSASALAQLVEPPAEALEKFDLPRDGYLDAAFACGMASGMGDYEEAASVRKAKLFRTLLGGLPRSDAVVAEVGMGSFPNAPYFAQQTAPSAMDIVGIDPNDKMASYAQDNARRARLTGDEHTHTHTHAHTQKHSRKHNHTHTHTHTHTHKHVNTHTHTNREKESRAQFHTRKHASESNPYE